MKEQNKLILEAKEELKREIMAIEKKRVKYPKKKIGELFVGFEGEES